MYDTEMIFIPKLLIQTTLNTSIIQEWGVKTLNKYLQESYEDSLKENVRLLNLADKYKNAIVEFTDKHFHGGAKANRDDYVNFGIPTADIFKLRQALGKEIP